MASARWRQVGDGSAMTLYAPATVIVLTAAALAFVSLPVWRMADGPPQPARADNGIDGLRGFLALGVFFHHAAIYRPYLETGVWWLPPSAFYTMCGQGGVALFFVITAYLFWARVVQGGGSDWRTFYIGRIFRIGPLYLVAFFFVLITVLHFGPGEPARDFTVQLGRWLMLGAGGMPDLNGYPETHLILAGVTWSLRYEWAFYLALPVLALTRRNPLLAPGAIFFLAFTATALQHDRNHHPQTCALLFSVGMLCAAAPALRLPRPWGGVAVIALAVAFLGAFPTAYAPVPILLAGAMFMLVAAGERVFGLLTARPVLRLGNISYGVYLLQGLVFGAGFALAPVRAYALSGTFQYWTVVFLDLLALIAIAVVAHALVERPGIVWGRRIARWTRLDHRRVEAPAARAGSPG
jgi:peptidoglycan/LPS O-acetylase OafA/YrhL